MNTTRQSVQISGREEASQYAAVLVAIGLRASIVVSPKGVVITRSWFFVPYRWYKAARIADVRFGGNWGLPDDACGIVVDLDGQEIHLGSTKTMHAMHAALLPLLPLK